MSYSCHKATDKLVGVITDRFMETLQIQCLLYSIMYSLPDML